MGQRVWINIGLLVFIVLLFATPFYLPKKAELETTYLSDINSHTISQIEIIRKDLDDFVFNKEDDAWFMRSPLQYEANPVRIDAMLGILNVASHSQLDPVELERFDLANPEIIMKLNHHRFEFGNTSAIDNRRYVLFNDQIHLIDDQLFSQLKTNAAFYANTKLLPMDFTINSITLLDKHLYLVDEEWRMDPPSDITPEQLKRIVYNWQGAAAISVSKYTEPQTTSVISINDAIEFAVISIEPYLILGRADIGLQYHLASDTAEQLLLKEKPKPSMQPATTTE